MGPSLTSSVFEAQGPRDFFGFIVVLTALRSPGLI